MSIKEEKYLDVHVNRFFNKPFRLFDSSILDSPDVTYLVFK